tara:strand:- start:1250 stop:1429 length:180 start_codon:yes stop_codon:yes gene_type:complete
MTDATVGNGPVPKGRVSRQVIYDGTLLRLEYTGPANGSAQRVLVAFAPFDYPFQTDEGG